MDTRENFLRAAEMKGPEWIPCTVSISPPLWHRYRERMEDVVLKHPAIFGEYRKGSRNFDDFGIRHKGNTVTDEWGCEWRFLTDGLQGQVAKHPLEDWKTLDSYKPPDPLLLNNVPEEGTPPSLNSFDRAREDVEDAKMKGKLAVGYCPHGFMFQRLYYLRGFSNLMKDFVSEPPELSRLIAIVLDYNIKLIRRWLDVGVDLLSFGDDLGMQNRLPISPEILRRHIIPAYSEMFITEREKGVHVRLHSDGHIIEVAGDLMGAGVSILNLQDLVNGIDNIRRRVKGKVCIDLDIDRQRILPFGTPQEVKKHVQKVVSTLNSPEGGFMVTVDIYPPTSLENIDALCQALEEAGGGVKF
jgi:uroporphyrinogen decarboxylase